MPHLIRMRIVSAGHPAARMDDLTFDFTDSGGRPVDSVIWLRNGGGKSSLLNLFFATLRPDKSDFLGAKAESKQRRLDHYILPGAPATVVCEWAMDTAKSDLFTETRHLLTGVFYERQAVRDGGDSPLKRFYFGAWVSEKDPRLTIAGIPLRVTDTEGRSRKRTLSAFRQEWTAMRDDLAENRLFGDHIQREWATYLEGVGIDPELFHYQIQMNLREGGAKEMFHFRESEDFADFLLRMVMAPDHAMLVSKNIRDFREKLYLRRDQLLPEAELTEGIIDRLAPLKEIAVERRQRLDELEAADARMRHLDAFIAERRETLATEKETLTRTAEAAAADAEARNTEADQLRRQSAALERRAARQRLAAAKTGLQSALAARESAERTYRLWRAAEHFATLRRHEAEAEALRVELHRKTETHAPLRDDLTAAARAYHAALSWRIRTLRQAQQNESASAETARKAAATHRAQADALKISAAKAENAAEYRQKQLIEAETERGRLTEDGVLQTGEAGDDAVARLKTAVENGRIALSRDRTALADIKTDRCRHQTDLKQLEERRFALSRDKDRLERDIAAARSEKTAIEARPVWTEALELAPDAADLNRLTGEGMDALKAESQRLFQRLMTLRIERSENERFRDHLERHGLLPPSPDAETVLKHLQSRLPVAWSGWTYISENAKDNPARRRMVKQHPDLAVGVVVRAEDFEKAVELLETSPPSLRTPVTMAPADAFSTETDARRHVAGLETDAYFDPAAGEAERVRIENRSLELDQTVSRLAKRHTQLQDDLSAIARFRETYPPNWFAAQTAAASEKAAAIAETETAVKARQQALEKAEADIQAAESRIQTRSDEIHHLERRLERAADFRDRVDRHLPALREELATFTASARADREQAATETEAAERTEADSRERDREAMIHGADASVAERERDAVEHLNGPPPDAEAGDVRALFDAYERLKRQYESEVGEAGLRQLIDRSRREAADARDALNRILRSAPRTESPVTEIDVADAVEALPETDAIQDELAMAETARTDAVARVAAAEAAVQHAETALKNQEAACRELGEIPEPDPDDAPADPDAATAEAERCMAAATEAQSLADAARREAETAIAAVNRHEARLQHLERDADGLANLRKSYADLLEQVDGTPEAPPPPDAPFADSETPRQVDALSDSLRVLRKRFARLDRQRDEAVRAVQSFAREKRFSAIGHSVGRRFREVAAEHLEAEIDGWLDKLAVRLATIRDELKETDTHRNILIRQLLDIAEDGLRLLKRAASRSVLPEGLPAMGGKRFMTVHTRESESPEEKKGRMADLLERFLEEGTIPSGIDLVQRAVRQLARRMRIRILHPDPDHYTRNIEIPELARLSGGEQLTGAILLFCTLAKLRARQRGRRADRSSVLLLDNPIGHASRVRFLTVQQTIARVMGVQLIFTTGINDPESLAVFPNIIRLKNERIDRNTGHRMIEPDPEPAVHSRIEGVRLVREAETEAPSDDR